MFGSQSTGKSTLLNHLFGTDFNVMDETARQQTTKGIWLSRATEDEKQSDVGMTRNILVMDVEGTDGRERGEDQDFERKSALFALATSEVMVRSHDSYCTPGTVQRRRSRRSRAALWY